MKRKPSPTAALHRLYLWAYRRAIGDSTAKQPDDAGALEAGEQLLAITLASDDALAGAPPRSGHSVGLEMVRLLAEGGSMFPFAGVRARVVSPRISTA